MQSRHFIHLATQETLMDPLLAKVLKEAMDSKLNLILQEYHTWKENFDAEIAKSVHHSFWDRHTFSDFGEHLYDEYDNIQGKEEISTTYKFLRDNGVGIRATGYEFFFAKQETKDSQTSKETTLPE